MEINSVKWIGLFVTSVVGLYTIQDLWDKFGDLKMPFVRCLCLRALIGYLANVRCRPILAYLHTALDRSRSLPDCSPNHDLYVLLQTSFLNTQPVGPRRCSNVELVPGASTGKRFRQQSARYVVSSYGTSERKPTVRPTDLLDALQNRPMDLN